MSPQQEQQVMTTGNLPFDLSGGEVWERGAQIVLAPGRCRFKLEGFLEGESRGSGRPQLIVLHTIVQGPFEEGERQGENEGKEHREYFTVDAEKPLNYLRGYLNKLVPLEELLAANGEAPTEKVVGSVFDADLIESVRPPREEGGEPQLQWRIAVPTMEVVELPSAKPAAGKGGKYAPKK